ncbi:MAG: hypothetical protein M9955_00090 [Rhizobiaceae bacterium]|nr:hypothetical protein [Rhizobiaceae bacterium]
MFRKKKDKSAAAAPSEPPAAPKKRSKVKLALFAVAPLVLAGGGYAGWPFVASAIGLGSADHAAAEGHGEGGHGTDQTHVSALPPEAVAEGSAAYSFALSELLKGICGEMRVDALRAASEAEAKTDGAMVHLAWIAANRRVGTVTEISCDLMVSEVARAEHEAAGAAEGGGKGGEKPAAHH